MKHVMAVTVSALALATALPAFAQEPASPSPQEVVPEPSADQPADEVVVTGIRESLEKAAQIKQNAIQVVDSIVAQDIGKLPDPTTAAALQRVPGIQVSVNRNNELGDVRVRGLPDVLVTVNGREMFTTTGRKFDLQDLPAEALARVDVYKSQTPDLLEGGLAGVIDLKLNKPLSFKKPTVVLSARGNYGVRVNELDPQFGVLLANQWTTGIGEIGVLLNGTFSQSHYRRDNAVLLGLRSAAAAPLNRPGVLIPNILQTFPEEGKIKRTQANAAIQWKPSDALEVYVDGLYTRFDDRGARYGANVQAFTTNSSLTDIDLSSNCYDATVSRATGQNPTAQELATPNATQRQSLCYVNSATLVNPVSNQTTQARDLAQINKGVGGGVTWDRDGTRINVDVSYQTSKLDSVSIIADVGQRLPSLVFRANDRGLIAYETSPAALGSRDNLFIRNSLQQGYGLTEGNLFATKIDGEREFGGILSKVKFGGRYAKRSADSYSTQINTAVPGGNIGTGTEARAVRVSDTGLPAQFLSISAPAPSLNNGARFFVPNPNFLLSDAGLDALRTYFRLPVGRPGFQQNRQFNADEETYSVYGMAEYAIPLGGGATIDGVLGARVVKTDRAIQSFVARTAGGVTTFQPVAASTSDKGVLPTATARLKLDNGIQARLSYAKSLSRPEFGQLNPVVTLSPSNNPFVQSTGSAGNPDLKQQKSNSYDATLEYYFRGGYVAVAGYYREISNRVLNGAAGEVYDGVTYSVTRPRNLGAATLKGVEVSGQYFFDFLPGALSGAGLQGAFTLADSKIGGNDPLAGNPLQGVSKYNYTAGLLYDKAGVSGRLVYTYRSKYFGSDQTGSISVRPEGENILLGTVRAAGRLDFNVGYDINDAVRVDVGGTNILRSKTRSYLGVPYQPLDAFYDETTYSVGLRVRL